MKSIIIISQDKKKSDKYISALCKEEEISKFDVSLVTGNTSIGIAEARKIKETIFLTPSMGNKKAVIIENANLLTAEAQNALLKILEEPPESAFIILVSNMLENFLPTAISRCEVINLAENNTIHSEKEDGELLKNLNELLSGGINCRLKLAQDNGKTKETALLFLEQIIKGMEIKLAEHQEIDLARKILSEGQKSYTLLKTTNINPRLSLEHFLLKNL